MSKAELVRRYVLFLFGLYVNSLGIALTTRANLGTSPITSVPYVLSIRFPLSLGMFTLFFSLLLIAIQLIILGKRFPKQFLLQLPVIPIFSLFIDLSWFVDPQTYPAKVCSLLLGCLVLGFGVFIEVAANVVMLPGECTVKAISTRWNTNFGKTKVAVDVTMAATAAVLGLLLFHTLTGVREGTFISALLVGTIARLFGKLIGEPVQGMLKSRQLSQA